LPQGLPACLVGTGAGTLSSLWVPFTLQGRAPPRPCLPIFFFQGPSGRFKEPSRDAFRVFYFPVLNLLFVPSCALPSILPQRCPPPPVGGCFFLLRFWPLRVSTYFLWSFPPHPPPMSGSPWAWPPCFVTLRNALVRDFPLIRVGFFGNISRTIV